MKIALFGRKIDKRSAEVFSNILKELRKYGDEIIIYKPFYEHISECRPIDPSYSSFLTHEELAGQADIVISLGGDGTILSLVSLIRDSQIPVLGINIGRLGFLSATAVDEFGDALQKIHNNEYEIESRALLQATTGDELFGEINYGLNEVSILSNYPSRMLSIGVWVDGLFLNNYWGDGLIVATPTGSTAYSLSCGGDILTPSSSNFIITPIAPHNLTVRPLILSDSSKIRIQVQGGQLKSYLATLDSRSLIIKEPIDICIEKAPFGFNFIRLEGKDFFQTLRSKLNWGLDNRN